MGSPGRLLGSRESPPSQTVSLCVLITRRSPPERIMHIKIFLFDNSLLCNQVPMVWPLEKREKLGARDCHRYRFQLCPYNDLFVTDCRSKKNSDREAKGWWGAPPFIAHLGTLKFRLRENKPQLYLISADWTCAGKCSISWLRGDCLGKTSRNR